jgi:hypothetical protein
MFVGKIKYKRKRSQIGREKEGLIEEKMGDRGNQPQLFLRFEDSSRLDSFRNSRISSKGIPIF